MFNYTKNNILIILNQLKLELSGQNYFKEIVDNSTYISFTCPFHSNHNEAHPSCSIVLKGTKTYFHCFTCNESGTIDYFVSKVLDISLEEANKWLLKILGDEFINSELLPEIKDEKKEDKILDESILINYDYYHPYMYQRKLSKEVIDRFRIGYNKLTDSLTFPVWDEKNKLRMVTERSTKTKRFYIPKDTDKGKYLYLLNFALQDKTPIIGVTEAQIDALTSWSYGLPCCATLGSPTKAQIKLLAKSGIRTVVTLFDNDESGQRFTHFFNLHCPRNIMVVNLRVPEGKKDINDLNKEEFLNSLKEIGVNLNP